LEIVRQRLARLMIEHYGASAAIQAAIQGNADLAKGDVKGLEAWLKVVVTIERMQATKPAEGKLVQ
jgi:hypothetical protein